MKFKKKAAPRVAASLLAVIMTAVMLGSGAPLQLDAQGPLLNPNLVRAAAKDIGMDSLANVILTDPATLLLYV